MSTWRMQLKWHTTLLRDQEQRGRITAAAPRQLKENGECSSDTFIIFREF